MMKKQAKKKKTLELVFYSVKRHYYLKNKYQTL